MGNGVSQSDFEPGDVLYRSIDGMELANHYGVYVGDGIVIDFSKEFGFRETSFKTFAKGYEVSKKSFSKTLPRDEIVEKARYYLKYPDKWGEYSLAFNNCEHFATLCATGEKRSGQVQKTVAATAVVGIAVIAGLLLYGSKDREDKDSVDLHCEDPSSSEDELSSFLHKAVLNKYPK